MGMVNELPDIGLLKEKGKGLSVWYGSRAMMQNSTLIASLGDGLSTDPSIQSGDTPPSPRTDEEFFDKFALSCKDKLKKSREKGRSGWNDEAKCSVEDLEDLFMSHLFKGNSGNFEDLANILMMLHQRGADPQGIALKVCDSQMNFMEKAMVSARIGVVPEYEGQWNADVYGESSEAVCSGTGIRPAYAVADALRKLKEVDHE